MSYVGKVTAGGGTHLVGSTLYGTCSTAAGTAAKVVVCSDFDTLLDGVTIHVKFTNSNLASNPTLNVNNTGAIRIYCYGSTPPSTSEATSWLAGSVVAFTYDGNYWQMNGWKESTVESYGVCDTSPGTQAKTVSIQDFKLNDGATVYVKFVNANLAANPTLNVSGTGAKAMYQYGTTPIGTDDETSGWRAGSIVCFVYDGVGWVREHGYNTNSTYTNESMGHGYGTCSTPTATPVKTVVLADYELTVGGTVAVQFTNAVSVAALMNINSQGAKDIYFNGEPITNGIIKAFDTALFIYDGYQYHLLSIERWGIDINTLVENLGSHSVEEDVPSGAVFTDTTYEPTMVTVGSASAGTAISASEITSWDGGAATTVSYANEVLTITTGRAASMTYSGCTIPNISITNTSVVGGLTESTSGAGD